MIVSIGPYQIEIEIAQELYGPEVFVVRLIISKRVRCVQCGRRWAWFMETAYCEACYPRCTCGAHDVKRGFYSNRHQWDCPWENMIRIPIGDTHKLGSPPRLVQGHPERIIND